MPNRVMHWNELESFQYTWGELSTTQWDDLAINVEDGSLNVEAESDTTIVGVGIEQGELSVIAESESTFLGVKYVDFTFKVNAQAEMQVVASASDRNFKSNMLKHLPLYYRKSKVFSNLLDAYASELRIIDFKVNDFKDDLYVDSITTRLARMEKILGIKTDESLDIRFRRKRIAQKMRSTGTLTKKSLKEAVEIFGYGEVEIIEDAPNFKFTVKFKGSGAPTDTSLIDNLLDEIKPAHMIYDYEYTYETWDMISGSWSSVSTETWDSLKLYG